MFDEIEALNFLEQEKQVSTANLLAIPQSDDTHHQAIIATDTVMPNISIISTY